MKRFSGYLAIMLMLAIATSIVGDNLEQKYPHGFAPAFAASLFTLFYWAKSLRLKQWLKTPMAIVMGVVFFVVAQALLNWGVWVFYYIGAAGYEYGSRNLAPWVYMLWGTFPHILLSGLATFMAIKVSHRLKNL